MVASSSKFKIQILLGIPNTKQRKISKLYSSLVGKFLSCFFYYIFSFFYYMFSYTHSILLLESLFCSVVSHRSEKCMNTIGKSQVTLWEGGKLLLKYGSSHTDFWFTLQYFFQLWHYLYYVITCLPMVNIYSIRVNVWSEFAKLSSSTNSEIIVTLFSLQCTFLCVSVYFNFFFFYILDVNSIH